MEALLKLDQQIFGWLNALVFRNPWLDWAIAFLAKYLDDWMLAGLLVFVGLALLKKFSHLRAKNWEMVGVALFAALVSRFAIAELIRYFFDRPRPFEVMADIHQLIFRDGGEAFPSGHASFYFALAAVISRYYPKTSLLFFAAATLQALGRVTAGLHWPSDILAGAFIGVLVGILAQWLVSKYLRH